MIRSAVNGTPRHYYPQRLAFSSHRGGMWSRATCAPAGIPSASVQALSGICASVLHIAWVRGTAHREACALLAQARQQFDRVVGGRVDPDRDLPMPAGQQRERA